MFLFPISLSSILHLDLNPGSVDSYYSVIAPGVLKSNRKYTVVASLHEAIEPALMRISIVGPSYHATQEVFLRPYETKKVQFDIFRLEWGSYHLIAEGISGIQFQEKAELIVKPLDGPKIYIQTDKTIYKPDDLVNFRIVMMDEHTKPLKIKEPIRIDILVSTYVRYIFEKVKSDKELQGPPWLY